MSSVLVEAKEFKNWVRKGEVDFLNRLAEYGDAVHLGRGHWGEDFDGTNTGLRTNRGLCDIGVTAMIDAAKSYFGEGINIRALQGRVRVITGTNEAIKHVFGRVATDKGSYTFDPTFGQIHDRINRILVFSTRLEDEIYWHLHTPTLYNDEAEMYHESHLRGSYSFPKTEYDNMRFSFQRQKKTINLCLPIQPQI